VLDSVTKVDLEDLAKDLNKILSKHPVYNAGLPQDAVSAN